MPAGLLEAIGGTGQCTLFSRPTAYLSSWRALRPLQEAIARNPKDGPTCCFEKRIFAVQRRSDPLSVFVRV